jgi:hypothetical protein
MRQPLLSCKGMVVSLVLWCGYMSVFKIHWLVNFVDCAFGLRWLYKEVMRMYTGLGEMSLRLVASCCSCYLH